MNKISPTALRLTALALVIALTLPNPALALRDPEIREKKPADLSGLEEALRSGEPDRFLQTTGKLLGIPAASSTTGLEEHLQRLSPEGVLEWLQKDRHTFVVFSPAEGRYFLNRTPEFPALAGEDDVWHEFLFLIRELGKEKEYQVGEWIRVNPDHLNPLSQEFVRNHLQKRGIGVFIDRRFGYFLRQNAFSARIVADEFLRTRKGGQTILRALHHPFERTREGGIFAIGYLAKSLVKDDFVRKLLLKAEPFIEWMAEKDTDRHNRESAGRVRNLLGMYFNRTDSNQTNSPAGLEEVKAVSRELVADRQVRKPLDRQGWFVLTPRLGAAGWSKPSAVVSNSARVSGGHVVVAAAGLRNAKVEALVPWVNVESDDPVQVVRAAKGAGVKRGDLILLNAASGLGEEQIRQLLAASGLEEVRVIVGTSAQVEVLPPGAFELFSRAGADLPPVIVLDVASGLEEQAGQTHTLLLMK